MTEHVKCTDCKFEFPQSQAVVRDGKPYCSLCDPGKENKVTTETAKRLARKAEQNQPNEAPRYIIVDDPEKPTKYWRYRSWSDSRADAHVFTHYQRDWWPTLPDGGVWLLVDEEIQAKAEKNSSTPSSGLPKAAEMIFRFEQVNKIDSWHDRQTCLRLTTNHPYDGESMVRKSDYDASQRLMAELVEALETIRDTGQVRLIAEGNNTGETFTSFAVSVARAVIAKTEGK